MTTKDLQAYASTNWEPYKASISDISKSGDLGTSLVVSEKAIYSFDNICMSMFPVGQAPTSADGLAITHKSIELIEFKCGFKQKITKKNFDPEKGYCESANKVCKKYWDLFFENQRKKLDELVTSLRFKAVESYITLEKRIFPYCSEVGGDNSIKVKLIVVIDEDGVDSMEDTLAQLAEKDTVSENCFMSIKKALKRLKNQHDAAGNTYYYDSIEVMSAQDFSRYLDQGIPSGCIQNH